ncbi:hypothetical protein [Maribacter sp. HTCC2170]|uniref:hypothetical protein n=1 Tax=Maribacter sp. (strain HTCC2170 / KCCM 42371) TaxID=313603 RepID=UPI00006BD56A|nr:hypothetical protein [Maribacter sp. HTCC2170]EAR02824.1 hypothetical protein FB2170_06035 [Maribacter sp. HTCC2170]
MALESKFKNDLKKEKHLFPFLDSIYEKHLKHYSFHRIHALREQLEGTDLILTHLISKKTFIIDEKAQLDYINDDLPTFAFELSYQKKGEPKIGWLFDVTKKTDFYSLITAIYSDEPNKFTSCKITFVNRENLVGFLEARSITQTYLEQFVVKADKVHGKIKIPELDSKNEGYLFYSAQNKAEKPLNLILKLDFLIENGLAKRLI